MSPTDHTDAANEREALLDSIALLEHVARGDRCAAQQLLDATPDYLALVLPLTDLALMALQTVDDVTGSTPEQSLRALRRHVVDDAVAKAGTGGS